MKLSSTFLFSFNVIFLSSFHFFVLFLKTLYIGFCAFVRIVQHKQCLDQEKEQHDREAEEVNKLQMQYELEKARLARVEREERAVLLEDIKRQIDDVNKMRQIDELREEVRRSAQHLNSIKFV